MVASHAETIAHKDRTHESGAPNLFEINAGVTVSHLSLPTLLDIWRCSLEALPAFIAFVWLAQILKIYTIILIGLSRIDGYLQMSVAAILASVSPAPAYFAIAHFTCAFGGLPESDGAFRQAFFCGSQIQSVVAYCAAPIGISHFATGLWYIICEDKPPSHVSSDGPPITSSTSNDHRPKIISRAVFEVAVKLPLCTKLIRWRLPFVDPQDFVCAEDSGPHADVVVADIGGMPGSIEHQTWNCLLSPKMLVCLPNMPPGPQGLHLMCIDVEADRSARIESIANVSPVTKTYGIAINSDELTPANPKRRGYLEKSPVIHILGVHQRVATEPASRHNYDFSSATSPTVREAMPPAIDLEPEAESAWAVARNWI
jgi:hypothetical protein